MRERERERERERQTDRQTDKHTDRQNRHIFCQTIESQMETKRKKENDRERWRSVEKKQ